MMVDKKNVSLPFFFLATLKLRSSGFCYQYDLGFFDSNIESFIQIAVSRERPAVFEICHLFVGQPLLP
jgi:hypothetical protein